MDGLLVKQAEIHTSIQILVNNFKKENALRRKAIAERRLKELNELISEFTENHLILNQYDDHSYIYFTDNYYENTKQFYKEACDYIKQYVESGQTEGARKTQEQIADKQKGAGDDILKVTAPKGIRGSVDINKKMEEKSKKQLANYKAFERTIKNINIDGITERWEHEDTFKTLESRWKAIDSLHWELESELEDLEREESEELYNRCETKYNNIKKAINSRMWSEKHREKTTPNLEVPTFGGNYNQWVSFKDLFSEAIHKNMSLSGAQKMQFLKSKVRGEAEKLIQHLPISSENYTLCWDIRNRRYNNKRRIFSAHINTFLELPTMKQQTLQQIKRMHDVTQESLNAIKNLGVDISTWDPLLIHILDQKLDSNSHLEYIESLKDCRELTTLHELSAAKMLIVKNVQEKVFGAELKHLLKGETVGTKSNILNLHPFIDKSGVLRVSGRLKNSTLNMEMKHPKIIPRDSRLAELLVNEAHKLTFHGGPRLTLANLRKQYWIPGGNNAVKKQLRKCVTCRKNNPTKHYQLMGDLPAARTEPAPPFYHTGVDYTGFVDIKENKKKQARTMKGYIALFICMVTKAIHLELVTDLTSSAFLAALRRMSARRGAPRHMYSDCGTNFVGANRILKEEYEILHQTFDENFGGVLVNMEIEWHFNVPHWPSAVGIWERSVQSVKYHLRRVFGEQRLTFEEFSTILAQVEACLNSRPLCALTEDIEDLDYLTPAHFLTGRAGVTAIQTSEDARTRWHLTNQIFQQIWKRWREEYLALLNARNKWLQPQRNIQIGDLVVVHDDNMPAGKWSTARVTELHPGRDGLVRVVSLKTKNNYIKRPIVKLSILPVHSTETEKIPTAEKKVNVLNMKTCTGLYSVVMALLFFMTLVSNTHGVTNITALNRNQTLYFDPLAKMQLVRDQWTLVTYYDMSPYWEGTKAFEKSLIYLEKTCNKLKPDNKCNIIAPSLRHEYTELQYYNQLLLTQHFSERSRQRRGLIDGVGYLANSLFGVLDQRFAKQYTRDIELIKHNKAHLKNLWSNQTSIVESEYNFVKRTEQVMSRQHKIVNKHFNKLDEVVKAVEKEVNEMSKVQDFALTAISTNSILQNLKNIQSMLLETITDIYQGQYNLHLLTPKQLQEQLNKISGLLTSDITLPIYEDYRTIYKLMKTRARMTEEYFIFEIRIPLVNREAYDLYHVIPIPIQHGEDVITVSPVSKYVGINLQKDSYLPLSEENLQRCISVYSSTYMCNPKHPTYRMKSDKNLCIQDKHKNCVSSKSECNNKWVGLARTNTYLHFCCELCQLRIICNDRVTMNQLTGANVIALEEDCVMKNNQLSIYGHKNYQSQLNVAYEINTVSLAPINDIFNFTIAKNREFKNETEIETTRLTKEIESKIKLMKQDLDYENEGRVSHHDVHHYTAIYCIVGVLLLVGVIIVGKRVRRSWTASTAAEMTAQAAHPGRARRAPFREQSVNKDLIVLIEVLV